MKRKFEYVDLMVSIGMVATMLGAYAFFQVTNGSALIVPSASHHRANLSMKTMVQAKLQPAIGQAIVDQASLERQFATEVGRGASKLATAMNAMEGHPSGGMDMIEARASRMKANHQARVQYVTGRAIVRLTHQAMRAGALSGDNLSSPVNERIIENAQALGMKMKVAFQKSWQSRLGGWIVTAAKREHRYAGHVQERIGQAMVELASTLHAYQTKQAELQTQFQALTAAAARTEGQSELFARAPLAEVNWQWALGIPKMPHMEVMEARAFPEIPITYLMVASLGMITLFFFGLTLPGRGRKPAVMANRTEKRKQEKYRKAS